MRASRCSLRRWAMASPGRTKVGMVGALVDLAGGLGGRSEAGRWTEDLRAGTAAGLGDGESWDEGSVIEVDLRRERERDRPSVVLARRVPVREAEVLLVTDDVLLS